MRRGRETVGLGYNILKKKKNTWRLLIVWLQVLHLLNNNIPFCTKTLFIHFDFYIKSNKEAEKKKRERG